MWNRTGLTLLVAGLSLVSITAAAEPELKPASERFATGDTDEVPNFRRHMVPLLGKVGCNSRACHGSFQGQGGFRLSLFGFSTRSVRAIALRSAPRPGGTFSLLLCMFVSIWASILVYRMLAWFTGC